MKAVTAKRVFVVVIAMFSMSLVVGCARIAGVSKNEYRDGNYYPTCLVEADRALNEARMAGKDKECPDEFNALKETVDNAYKVHFGCNTEGACKMAKDAAGKARTLTCAPKPAAQKPAPAPVPAPALPAPKANISVAPASVSQGQSAKLTWTSQNATNCNIQPNIGPVKPQGSMEITPAADTAYTLTCTGAGGTADSTTHVSVLAPPPAPKPAPRPEQLCMTLNIEFATAKADIPAKYHDEIAKIANFMKEYPQVKGVIEGHTDNRGGKAYNEKLSERRAQSVKNYIVKNFGIDASRLGVKGYGFSKPVADNATAEGRQLNRRIVANFDCVEK